ncbi:hypothetical protein ABZY44_04000 [Streptomyces sp. NPDC006544]|uniref:hypothetical protein n=1 Tax=Streptomyces sp. NPDC006544 TaxID=3154583 RepID=UPI0033A3ACE4
MSYDLAVWVGERPADDAAAALCFTDLYDRYIDSLARIFRDYQSWLIAQTWYQLEARSPDQII